MKRHVFLLALVACAFFVCASTSHAQVFGSRTDSTRHAKTRKQKEALPSDTLPSVYNHWNRDTDKDTSKRKRTKPSQRKVDTVNVFSESTYSIVTQPVDTVQPETEKPKKNRRSSSFETDTTTNAFENNQADTLTSRKRKRDDKHESQHRVWDSIPVEQAPLTRDQIASMLLDSGNYHLNKNNYPQAIHFFDSIVGHYNGTFQYRLAYYFRGKAKMSMNKDVPAMVDFNMFNTLDKCQSSFCTDAHYNLAVLKFRNDKVDDCLKELEWVFKDSTYKNYKYAYFYRGFCRAGKGEYIAGIQDLTKFLDLDESKTFSSAEALYYRGFYKAQMADNRGAIRDYDEAIKLYEAGLNVKANPAYQQKLIDTYIVRALAKADIKKYDDAISDYDVVIRMNPKYATAYRLKGLSEIGKGDKDNGCLNLSRAGELGSNEAYEDIKQHCR